MNMRDSLQHHLDAGFSLIEMAIVLAIVGFVLGHQFDTMSRRGRGAGGSTAGPVRK